LAIGRVGKFHPLPAVVLELPDVTGPGIETIALTQPVGLQIERDGAGFADRGGDDGKVTRIAYQPLNRVRSGSDVSDGFQSAPVH
jgi:hypothetical protein